MYTTEILPKAPAGLVKKHEITIKYSSVQLGEHRLKIITLLSAINLKRRSLSLGKRPQDSKENNGPVAAERFDITWIARK
jgi:hypothetical protein